MLKQHEGDRLTPRGNRYLDTIVESAVSAGQLVDNLLTYSQMGRATLQIGPVDMQALVEEQRRRLEADAPDRDLHWSIGPLPPARGDPGMIRLIVQNLVGNAVKFTRDRKPAKIEIGAEPQDGFVEYRVSDNGVGFDMAYVGKLFGVFQRLHRTEDFEGTGIGLANVKRMVERHGGPVTAEGALGEGATFRFTLPKGETDHG